MDFFSLFAQPEEILIYLVHTTLFAVSLDPFNFIHYIMSFMFRSTQESGFSQDAKKARKE